MPKQVIISRPSSLDYTRVIEIFPERARSRKCEMTTLGDLTVTRYKTLLTTANPFEHKFGYHRAVRRGPFIATSGTTALKLLEAPLASPSTIAAASEAVTKSVSKVHFPDDAYRQTIHVLETCLAAVSRLGGKKEDVVRVRMFVANSNDCGAVGSAFRETFGVHREGSSISMEEEEDVVATTATMIVVSGGFVDGEILVEIEVDAFVA